MADLPEQNQFEGLYNRGTRHRRVSNNSVNSSSTIPTLRRNQHLSNSSVRSYAGSETDRSEIHSPIPRRHLLLRTESQQWLNPGFYGLEGERPKSPLARSTSAMSSSGPPGRLQSLSFSALSEPSARPFDRISHPSKDKERGEKNVEKSPGRDLIRWMHVHGLREWVVVCILLGSACVKWSLGLGPYSGAGMPPMFGDYEAQRHWMELTIHLPTHRWYTYDLQYWGLDYPPLTAYHSWICGIIGSYINSGWFALDTSRGIETESSKVFMRSTALVSDALIYIPALLLFIRNWHGSRSLRRRHMALLTLVLQPCLLLVDFGHFQYNSVMLGFTLMAMNFFATNSDFLGAACFVLSLGFKQMSLYYAPAIGAYLFGKCLWLGGKAGLQHFISLGVVTLSTFYILFTPFLPPLAPLSAVLDPITRIFPFSRGLFEDKVANFWCASNVILKWRSWVAAPTLIKLSTLFTALGFLPAVVMLLRASLKLHSSSIKSENKTPTRSSSTPELAPTLPLLPYALLNSSMSFFLFSFQVHEKTILLPMMPLTLLLSGSNQGTSTFDLALLGNNVAMFSIWPLIKREGLGLQYLAITFLWNWCIGAFNRRPYPQKSFLSFLSSAAYTGIVFLHTLELLFNPPSRYPDLFPVLNVLLCTPVFVVIWLWSMKRSLEISWALSGL